MKELLKRVYLIVVLLIMVLVLSGCENESLDNLNKEALEEDISKSIVDHSSNTYDDIKSNLNVELDDIFSDYFYDDETYTREEVLEVLSQNSDIVKEKVLDIVAESIDYNAEKLSGEVCRYIEHCSDYISYD